MLTYNTLNKGVWCPIKYLISVGCGDLYYLKWKWKTQVGYNSQCQNMSEYVGNGSQMPPFCIQILKISLMEGGIPPFHTNPPVALRAPVVCCAHHHNFFEPPLAETCVRAWLISFVTFPTLLTAPGFPTIYVFSVGTLKL